MCHSRDMQQSVVACLIGNIKNQNVIWEGNMYMSADQTAKLSQKISEQKNGICVVFSALDADHVNAQDNNWHSFFVPKQLVALKSGGHRFVLSNGSQYAWKYLYFSDTQITGNDANRDTTPNDRFALRYVIGL